MHLPNSVDRSHAPHPFASTLTQAKKFVESVPQVVKEGLSKEDAEALQKKLMDLGCTVILE